MRCRSRAVSAMVSVALVMVCANAAWPQTRLSVHWEELTAADFRTAIHQAQGTCLLPFGILEKHGPHLPLGTDLQDVRHVALRAAEQGEKLAFARLGLLRTAGLDVSEAPDLLRQARDFQTRRGRNEATCPRIKPCQAQRPQID